MATTVTMNVNPGFSDELKAGPEYVNSMRQLAVGGAKIAQGLAPVRTGRFRSSIQPVGSTADDMGITANHATWHWYEFGNYHLPPYAPLRGAIEQLGLEFQNAR